MTYSWNPAGFAATAAVPAAAVDEHLRLAGKAPVKVLLWLARHGCAGWNADACAQGCGLTPAAAQEGLAYWVAAGMVLETDGEAAATAVVPPAETSAPPVEKAPGAQTARARPAVVKPTMQEVIARRESSAEYGYLLDVVSARLGKPLTHGDMETLLYLMDTAGLPVAVLQLIVEYAASQGKYHMRYIERVALDWSDRGIVTVEAAEQQLCAWERRQQAWDTVSGWLGLTHSPTVAQSDAAVRWLYDWHMDEELVKFAAALCQEKVGKFQSGYISRILDRWHSEGIDTVEKARAEQDGPRAKKRKSKETKEVSFDLDAYETMVNTYTPVYRKKAD